MQKAFFLLITVLAVLWAASAGAELEFNADFTEDGTYDVSWPMKNGEMVTVDIYVSNVPAPGLISMGFKLAYDAGKLEAVEAGTGVDADNWPIPYLEMETPGEIEMAGALILESEENEGHKGDHIRLGTVRFRCVEEGTSELKLLKREGDWFVLFSEEGDPADVLDDHIDTGGVLLATIRTAEPGDVNGDGSVDLADAILVLRMMALMHHGHIHSNADVSGDGRIGQAESIYILQELSKNRIPGPPPIEDNGETRIDFVTEGDRTSMRCDFAFSATAEWHWADGSSTPAVSGADAVKTGLGVGEHSHYLLISNGAAVIRFGASDGGGHGNLVEITGLEKCLFMEILYAYNEESLTKLGRTHNARVREYHLMGTGLSPAAMDQVFADAVATNVLDGTIWSSNPGTSAGDEDRALLEERGWTIY